MAKIIIELDTRLGDTFRTVLDAFLDATPAGRDIYDPNVYKAPPGSTSVVFTEDANTETPDLGVTPEGVWVDKKKYNGPLMTPEQEKAAFVIPALSDMDGDRKRGEAAPGHRRRTNAQIESDKLWEKQKARAEAALKKMDAGVHDEMKIEGVKIDTSGGGASFTISTGEERINPEDAADEAAETAARLASETPTLEDLRAVVALYIDKFGHAASVKNMKTIIGCAVAECPVAEIPNAIAKVKLAMDGGTVITPVNPATGKPSAELFDDEPAPVTATKAAVVEAIKAYGRKYDGNDTDQDKMPITREDVPRLFTETFGAGVTNMSTMPDQKPETLGKILVAIKAATEENKFGREAKS